MSAASPDAGAACRYPQPEKKPTKERFSCLIARSSRVSVVWQAIFCLCRMRSVLTAAHGRREHAPATSPTFCPDEAEALSSYAWLAESAQTAETITQDIPTLFTEARHKRQRKHTKTQAQRRTHTHLGNRPDPATPVPKRRLAGGGTVGITIDIKEIDPVSRTPRASRARSSTDTSNDGGPAKEDART